MFKTFLLAILIPGIQYANAQHIVSGIANSNEGRLPGAIVKLTPGTIGTAADSNGYFELANVPDGSYDLQISYVGYISLIRHFSTGKGEREELGTLLLKSDANVIEGVTVNGKGTKGSAAEAIRLTRNATRLVTVLSSEGIKKMPDKNVAEAVQRVAGVKMERNKGEVARYL